MGVATDSQLGNLNLWPRAFLCRPTRERVSFIRCATAMLFLNRRTLGTANGRRQQHERVVHVPAAAPADTPSSSQEHVPKASTSLPASPMQQHGLHGATRQQRPMYQLAEAPAQPALAATTAWGALPPGVGMAAAAAGVGLAALGASRLFFRDGSRAYDGNVGTEYDAWTQEGILEYYVSGIHLWVQPSTEMSSTARAFAKLWRTGPQGSRLDTAQTPQPVQWVSAVRSLPVLTPCPIPNATLCLCLLTAVGRAQPSWRLPQARAQG